ncbi:MAG: UDP-2,3-diacylglucosamine diphosphatase [Paludibacteraceae bacterium]|nr:UDP-2,3-diacylglucosamine diphosphatase [Paludibacteraceae bacterium]
MIYFLSDAHIGSRAMADRSAHQQQVVHVLQTLATDADEVWLLGDIFDFWYEYLWPDRSKDEYQPVLDQLRAMTDRGIAVHFIIGNHDLWTFGALARRTGITVHRTPQQLTRCGKRLFLAHGDGLVPDGYLDTFPPEIQRKIRRFMRLRRVFHNPLLQFLFRLLPPAWGNRFGYGWARQSRLKELAHPCGYKGEQQEELVLWAKQHPGCDYYIFGHRHIELDLELGDRSRVLILGDMFRQWTYARLTDDGRLEMLSAADELSD